MAAQRMRIDMALVARGLAPTRAAARALVDDGLVRIAGQIAAKPAQMVAEDTPVTVADGACPWVSRAGLKLAHGLDAFDLSPQGRRCLDIGASTGGFTDVLLAQGAAHVTAIDVGHGQLHPKIATDPRVTAIEGLNARDLTAGHVAGPVDMIVADVSFIGLAKALPPALALAVPDAVLVALVKPQFEVGPALVGRGGIVRDPAAREAACSTVEAFLTGAGWDVIGRTHSPIAGGDGNIEFLVGARHRA